MKMIVDRDNIISQPYFITVAGVEIWIFVPESLVNCFGVGHEVIPFMFSLVFFPTPFDRLDDGEADHPNRTVAVLLMVLRLVLCCCAMDAVDNLERYFWQSARLAPVFRSRNRRGQSNVDHPQISEGQAHQNASGPQFGDLPTTLLKSRVVKNVCSNVSSVQRAR